MTRSEMWKKRFNFYPFTMLIFFAATLSFRCSDFFTGPGPQPSSINDKIEFDPKFSVFGVLRPDSTESGLSQSFIKVEKIFPINNWDSDVNTASVLLNRIDDEEPAETFRFECSDLGYFPDSLFRHPEFFPQAGET